MDRLFQCLDYKDYLRSRLDHPPVGGRGARARLCNLLGCQTSYLAQVLRGSAHLSAEHAEATNDFLNHSDLESEYFLLLVLLGRAGSTQLRRRLEKQLRSLKEKNLLLKNRLEVGQTLSSESQARYYSAWYYGAIHALVSIPGCQTVEAISKHLRLGMREAKLAIEFLVQTGILRQNNAGFEVGTTRMHLGVDSPLVSKHHMNWRAQAMRALENFEPNNLHYTSAVSLSESDFEIIREKLVQEIIKIKKTIQSSKGEIAAAFCMDFFKL